MKAYRLAFVLLLAALFVAPLFCVNSSLFNPRSQDQNEHFYPQLFAYCKDRPLDLDFAKFFYYPEEWKKWYRMYVVGYTECTEEDRYSNQWVMAYDTDVVKVDGKPVMATTTDYTGDQIEQYRAEYTYAPNSPNQPATITTSYLSNNQWMLDGKQTYSYNEYGGLINVTGEEYQNGVGWVLTEQSNCICILDRLTQVSAQYYDFDQGIWVNCFHMTLTWTGNQLNETIGQDWIDNAWQNSYRNTLSYSGEDNLHQVTDYWWNEASNTWSEDYQTTFTFTEGLWTEELDEEYITSVGWLNMWKGIMSYNVDGFPTTQIGYSWDNSNWELSERMSFYYDGSANDDDNAPTVPLAIYTYPNPFVGETTVSFKLPQSGQTKLSIYNIRGQLVRNLVNEPLTSGQHTVTWDGKDDSGKALASGMYLCRISSAGKQETHKMLLMK